MNSKRIRYSIGHEGWSYLMIGAFVTVGAVFRDARLLTLLIGLMAGPFLFNWRMAGLTVRHLSVRRRTSRQVCAGELLTVDLLVRGERLPFGVPGVTATDTIRRVDGDDEEEPSVVSALAPAIAAGGASRTSYRCLLTRRGRYKFGPTIVSCRFPFGLVRASRKIDVSTELLVCPRLGTLTGLFSDALESQHIGSRYSQPRRGQVDGDYYGLREWRSGDSRRWIHWRTSAKRGDLFVREFEEHRHRDVALLVDLWQPGKPKDEHRGYVELALSLAATIVAELGRRGARRVAFALAGDEVYAVDGLASMQLADQALERMATMRGVASPPIGEAVERLTSGMRQESRLLVVTTSGQRIAFLQQAAADQSSSSRNVQRAVADALWLDVSSSELPDFFRLD